jgi:hypothetical protein
VNVVIVAAGIVGLVVAAYGIVDLIVSPGRRRRLLDIALVLAAAAATIAVLLRWGDRLLQ